MPEISTQLPPVVSQRSAPKARPIGCEPVHVPGLAGRVWPVATVPEIDGA